MVVTTVILQDVKTPSAFCWKGRFSQLKRDLTEQTDILRNMWMCHAYLDPSGVILSYLLIAVAIQSSSIKHELGENH